MKIKGNIIAARRDFVKEHFGDAGWEQVLAALPGDERRSLEGSILATAWFPFELGDRLDKTIVSVLGKGDPGVFEELGVKSAQKSLSQMHKKFLTPGDPQAFLRKADMIYHYYYDTGRREYRETGPCSGVLTTFDAETFSAPDCLTVIGWYKEALRQCGARDVAITEEECRASGGACCRYAFSWKM
ncbi:MAG TPA: TIGR02265 family protein [Candidatus Edwardsbacteria bacterium]|nr:TIGR02265 family protein [Candidatus Edwardsbacteria bacterium]